jgi:hypothetical protein
LVSYAEGVDARTSLLAVGLLLAACGRKQAADPRDVLGEEMRYRGVDGRTGTPAAAPVAEDPDAGKPADAEECRSAADHLVALGVDLAIQEERDPQQKQKLAAQREQSLASEQARALSREWTQQCLDRGDTRGEVACILRAQREAELERCAPSP